MPTRNKPQSQLGSGASRKAEQAKARRIATLHEKIQRTATELTRLLDSGEFFKPVRKIRPRKTPRTATSFQVATIGTVTITSNVAPDFYKYPSFKDKIKTEGLRLSGRLAFTYAKTPGDETRRTVLLLGAYPASMPQYLVGHCELRNEERTFVIDRISLVTNLLDGQAVHDLRQLLTSIGVRSQT